MRHEIPVKSDVLPIPVNETERLKELHSLKLIDSNPEELYDDITRIAAELTGSASAFISLVDENRVWVKSGLGGSASEVQRCDSFCQHTIMGYDLFEVQDALKDELFADIPVVKGEPHWRFYAGVPLTMPGNLNVGALCILDVKPRALTELQKQTLKFLANTVVHLMKLRKSYADLTATQHMLKVLQEINEDFIKSPESKRDLFKKMLDYVLNITGSEYGFIGEVFLQDGKRVLRTYAITDISWNEETAALFQKQAQQGMLFTNHETLFGYTLKTGETIISNNPASDARSGGTPKGHPPLKCYMGLAIKDNKDDLIGMMGLANKQNGYTDDDIAYLQPFVTTCGTMIIALKSLQERAQVEAENREIYQKLLTAQSIAKLGSWEYDMPKNEVVWSDELYSIYELAKEGKILNYRSYHARLHPDDVERNDAIATQAIHSGVEFTFEERLVFPDGRKKIVLVNGYPIRNDQGEVVKIQGTTQDITARKWQEEEVQRFFDLAVDLFCIASNNGYLLRTSRSFTTALGFSEKELREKPFVDLVHPDDQGKTRDEFDFILRGGTSRNFENRYLSKSGNYVVLNWTATFDAESQLVYASAKDVTERKALEQHLIETQIEAEKSRAKDTFLANMSHEIRTPLNAIIGFNDILARTPLSEEQRKNVDFIGNASKTLSVLINDILDISKLESGKLDLEHEPFEVQKVVRQVVQMHASKAKSKGLKLMLSYDTDIPNVLIGDETRLLQILINLVSNAVKFTEKGSVELRVTDAKHMGDLVSIQFEVKDTGIGIRKEKLDLIFERFTQAESYTTRVYGGTGLGLNIVQSLVDLHHGILDVKSEWGVGSSFTFTLDYPIATSEDLQRLEDGQHVLETARLEGMSILLVEDNEHNQILAETYLAKHHATVDLAANGNIALTMLKSKSYDAILMDIQMPIMDGLATTEILRKEMGITTPIVACSAHAMASERKKCKDVGMNDYISKPYTEEILVNTLAKHLKAAKPRDFEVSDDFKTVIGDLERNISKTYADKIVGIFKQRLPHEIHLIRQAIDERDMKLIEERAHYQSGSMSSLRFTQGYQLSHAAEIAAQDKQVDKALHGAERLLVYLNNLLHFLNTGLNESQSA